MKYGFVFLFILIQLVSNAQVTISGKITDAKNNPVASASVGLENSYDGATSDSTGYYSFTTTDTGKQVFTVTMVGFETLTDTIYIHSSLEKNVTLKFLVSTLDAVVISAGTFMAGDKNKSTVLSSIDIVTTANANGDITNAIKTLPGAQQVGESEGLFVRGGTAGETKYFIDGSLVNKFYYTSEPGQATRGRFNPFLFEGTLFSSGGYSALYGQALSSVLILESIDLPQKTSASLGVSYLGVNGGIQKLSKNKKSSWGVSYGYTDLDLAFALIKQKPDYFKAPKVHEMDANFRFKTKGGMVKYYGTFSSSKIGFRYQDIDYSALKDAFDLNNINTYHNLSWKEKLGKGWKLQLSSSYTFNRDKINSQLQDQDNKPVITADPELEYKSFDLKSIGNYANGKWVLIKNIGGMNTISFGNEYNHSDERNHFVAANNFQNNVHLKENLLSTFAEADIYLTHKFAARAGLRSEHSQLFSRWNLAPRFSLAYKFPDKGQVSLAYGLFYQNPESKYLPATKQLHFEEATHYILQYQKIANKRVARAEIFYKKYNDLVKTEGSQNRLTAINNKGFGEAKGLEIFWRDKKSFNNVDYWVSYSYLDTHRDFLYYPKSITPSFAAKHTASLVLKTFVLRLKTQFNASYTFASGRPYYDFTYDQNSGKYTIRQQGHTKSFNDLSLSVNYLPSIGKKNANSFSVLVLSVTNVLGAENIYGYNFSADGKKLAIVPPAKRFIYIGYFISFGIDRTQDAIDSHL